MLYIELVWLVLSALMPGNIWYNQISNDPYILDTIEWTLVDDDGHPVYVYVQYVDDDTFSSELLDACERYPQPCSTTTDDLELFSAYFWADIADLAFDREFLRVYEDGSFTGCIPSMVCNDKGEVLDIITDK